MATSILQVETEYCGQYVDDIRLSSLAQTNPPLYARKMWAYFKPAISLFSIPAEMPAYLVGTVADPKIVEPKMSDYSFTAVQDISADYTLTLGDEFKGFELFSANIIKVAESGRITAIPATMCEYNAESGTITIRASASAPIAEGTTFYFDFYTDGEFKNDLSLGVMNILGMCFQCVWADRFNSDWLSNVSKVEDKSFFEQNRANKERADTERLNELRKKLAGEMRRFEQNLYYGATVTKKVTLS